MSRFLINKFVPVNTDNVFRVMDKVFQIDESVKEYRVSNPAVYDENNRLNDFSNESMMEIVHVVLEMGQPIKFYNQNEKEITPEFIKLLG